MIRLLVGRGVCVRPVVTPRVSIAVVIVEIVGYIIANGAFVTSGVVGRERLSFSCVREFLFSQARGRPQTFEEICLNVGKSRSGCWREVNTLLLFREVNIIILRFNGRECPFYTVRGDVGVEVIRGPVLVEVSASKTLIVVDELER